MIGFIVAGLVIGLLARLVLPGRQKIGCCGRSRSESRGPSSAARSRTSPAAAGSSS